MWKLHGNRNTYLVNSTPPVLAFFLIVLFTNKNKALSHSVAVGAAFLSWLGCMIVFVRALGVEHLGEHPFASSINWLPTGDMWLKIGVLIDPLSAATLFFVAWTVLMIFIYSVGYHNYGQPAGDHDHAGLPPHGATVTDDLGRIRTFIEPMYALLCIHWIICIRYVHTRGLR